MNQDPTKRKLTAIFSADVVGYSRLMEEDESWTIQNLEENKKIMSSLIEEHNGRVVDSPGDNLLAEFSSVINAVECAVKVQEQLNNKNSKLMEDNRMHFRIGVNLGDVVEEEDRIYGNGVNIAARLEGLAEPGGICISGTAYDQVLSKLNLKYDYLGEHSVKNIAVPVRAYRILTDTEEARKISKEKKSHKILNSFNIAIAIIILLVATLGITIAIFISKSSESNKVVRFIYELPENQQFNEYFQLAMSPDGNQFVYCTTDGLYLRSMNDFYARRIIGTNGFSSEPVFSPDGQWIAYSSEGKLKKIASSGGTSIDLCDIGSARAGLSWNLDNTIVFSNSINGGIKRVSADGGTPKTIIKAEVAKIKTDGAPIFPQILPDGKTILFANTYDLYKYNDSKITILSLESGDRKELVNGIWARYLPTGHLVYAQEKNNVLSILAVAFDLDTQELKGGSVSLIDNIVGGSVSNSGTLIYIVGALESFPLRTLVWVDKEGNEKPVEAEANIYQIPQISPDGKQVLLRIVDPDNENQELFIWDEVRKTLNKRTFDKSNKPIAIWTHNGERIVYASNHEGANGVYWRLADGRGEAELLVSIPDRSLMPYSISNDGKFLAMYEVVTMTNSDISILSLEDDSKRTILLQTENIECQPKISPDNQYIAYTSNESGQNEIWVRPFPNVNEGRWQVSQGGGVNPLWSPDGKKLFYLSLDNSVMAVDVETKPTFDPGAPKILFKSKYVAFFYTTGSVWDIHPDGDRFLMIKPPPEVSESEVIRPREINVVMNWDEELKQRVPVD